jgi:hypothetical protein
MKQKKRGKNQNSSELQPDNLTRTASRDSGAPGHRRTVAIVAAATLVALVPFAFKAVHLDDTVFIYVAKQISQHPLDPFGLTINWYGHQMPLHEVQQNGPLASYYMAIAASLLGWNEFTLHLAFLLPALACAIGMLYLSERLCSQPLLATLILVFSPVFVISGTTLMCDVMMLAFWIWAVLLWIVGIDRKNHLLAILSALLIGAGILTKYYAAAIIPLLLVYSLMRWPVVRWRVMYLLIPVAIAVIYDAMMASIYGHSLLRAAGDHALQAGGLESSIFYRVAVGLSFTGGCLAGVLFYAPLLLSRLFFFLICLVAGLVALTVPFALDFNGIDWDSFNNAQSLAFIVQFAVYFTGGGLVLALAARDLYNSRDAEAWLLSLWVVGTFVFCSLLNWTTNGRSILPMAPPVSLLIIRALPAFKWSGPEVKVASRLLPLGLSAILSFWIAWADYCWANSARSAAFAIDSTQKFNQDKNRVYFTGHWGFQYYMDALGYPALDRSNSRLTVGDYLIFPENNTNVPHLLVADAVKVEELRVSLHPLATTMRAEGRAGFYSSQGGQIPFAIGWFPDEKYRIMQVMPSDLSRLRILLLETAIEKQPDDASLRHQLAIQLMINGRIQEAVNSFNTAIEIDANNIAILNDFAWVLATMPDGNLAQRTRALVLAEQANSKTGGRSAELLDTLAAALAANQKFDEAIDTARQALLLLPNDPEGVLFQQISGRIRLYEQRLPFLERDSASAPFPDPLK